MADWEGMDAHRPRGRLIVAGLLVLIGLVGLVNVGRAQLSPTHQPGRENAHVRSLARALDAGAGPQMQALFPEGEFFSWTLTGLAAARLAGDGVQRDDNLAVSTGVVRWSKPESTG